MGRGIRRKLFTVFGKKSLDGKHLLTAEDDVNAACESDYSEDDSEPERLVKKSTEPVISNQRKGDKSDLTVSTTPTASASKGSRTDNSPWRSSDSNDISSNQTCSPAKTAPAFQPQCSLRLTKSRFNSRSRSFASAPAAVVASDCEVSSASAKQPFNGMSISHREQPQRTSSIRNLFLSDFKGTPITKPSAIQRNQSPTAVADFIDEAEFISFLQDYEQDDSQANRKRNEEDVTPPLQNKKDCIREPITITSTPEEPVKDREVQAKPSVLVRTPTEKKEKALPKEAETAATDMPCKSNNQLPHSSGETVMKSINKALFANCQGLNMSADSNSLVENYEKQHTASKKSRPDEIAFSVASTFATMINSLLNAFNCGILNPATDGPVGEIFATKSNSQELQRLMMPQEIICNKGEDSVSIGNITDYTAEWSLAMRMKAKVQSGNKKPNIGMTANPYSGPICEEPSDYFMDYKAHNVFIAHGYISASEGETSDLQ